MKHSIRIKLTMLLTALIFFTVFLCWFINRTFLETYYIHSKMEVLADTFEKVQKIYKEDTSSINSLSDSSIVKMDQIQTNKNVRIYVFNNKLEPSYPTKQYFRKNEYIQILNTLMDHAYNGSNPNILKKRMLKNTDTYTIYRLYDISMKSNYIDLIGLVDNNKKVIFVRTTFETIHESAVIANKFLAYIGILATLIGTLIMLFISKKFTDPIMKLADIAKKMSDLDFDVKYTVKTKDEIGELGSSINILSDKLETTITELKQANNELHNDIQKKIEIDEMRKEFLSNVSHELKTPISLIQGYAEGLKENINEDEESRDFYCEVIMDEANKMNKMVKKLLSLNEIEFGNNQLNFERFDIVALIHSVLDATDILFKQKEVVLHFEADEPVYVWADEFMVEQVVTNYISNALNHVSGAKIIEIKLIKHNDVVRIAVFNTGENIPEDELDKIWIKFYKVDKARTREYGGSGIGLSIVKAIMNSLNRECGVINRPVGVEFWFELDAKSE